MADARSPAAKDRAGLKGLSLWLVIATIVLIGLVLAFRHGGAVTSLIGSTT